MSMLDRVRAALLALGCDPDVVPLHLEREGWPEEYRFELETTGLLSVLYREVGRLLALAADTPDVPGCS